MLLIEAARSRMELLAGLGATATGATSAPASTTSTRRASRRPRRWGSCSRLPPGPHPEQIWVNPDCGLKTRAWPEVEAALRNMVAGGEAAARRARPGRLAPAGLIGALQNDGSEGECPSHAAHRMAVPPIECGI